MDKGTKLTALLDCGAEVNVMTRKVMAAAGLAMQKNPCLELVTHTGHHRPFLGVMASFPSATTYSSHSFTKIGRAFLKHD